MSIFRRINQQFELGPWWAKILLAGFYGLGFGALWILVRGLVTGTLDPLNKDGTRWIGDHFGDSGIVAATLALFVALGALFWWSKRRWG